MNYQALRDFDRAAKCFDRGIAADPKFFINHWLRGQLDFDRTGDLTLSEQMLARTLDLPDPDGQIALARFRLKLLQRRYQEALEVLNQTDLKWLSAWRQPTPIPRALLLANIYRLLAEPDRARVSYLAAQHMLEEAVAKNPTEPSRHALLGEAYAGLGRKNEALREGKRAIELLPESKDALDGSGMTLALARIHTALGDTDAALALVQHLLAIPAGLSVEDLKADPRWDPLRTDPRFEKIVRSFIPQKPN